MAGAETRAEATGCGLYRAAKPRSGRCRVVQRSERAPAPRQRINSYPFPMKTLVLLFIALSGSTACAAAAAGLRAGAATSNITPELGLKIVGGFAPYPAEHVHDELHARCLVLDDGKTKLALVVCDLLGLHRSLSVEARRLIQEGTGIPPENVMISATHTHSAATALGTNRYTTDQALDE